MTTKPGYDIQSDISHAAMIAIIAIIVNNNIAFFASDCFCVLRNNGKMNTDFLQKRLKELGKTQANLASFLGRDPAAISRAMKGERQFKDYEIAQIARFLEVPIKQLLDEDETPYGEDNENPTMLDDFIMVNQYDVEVSAGQGSLVEHEKIIGKIAFTSDWLRCVTTTPSRHLSLITVRGDSMEPTLKSGDDILVDMTKTKPQTDGIYIIRFEDGLLVKRMRIDFIKKVADITSDNAFYSPLYNVPLEEISVVGRVIWIGKQV